jgi:thioredoxin-related protein
MLHPTFTQIAKFGLPLSLLIGSVSLQAQPEQAAGIRFEEGLSWSQVQAKAKAENKLIFVDCFATWCAPCKTMDEQVYSDSKVAELVNQRFVSVKVQMDTTKRDSDSVKVWRADAASFAQKYNITAYPSFLFFSADGTALTKAAGAMSSKDFMALTQDATEPQKQYYTQLAHYRANKAYVQAPVIIKLAHSAGEADQEKIIALDYIDHYLSGLEDEKLRAKDNIDFVLRFQSVAPADPALGSSGRIFQALLAYAGTAPMVAGIQKSAREFVESVITDEAIGSKVYVGTGKERRSLSDNPDWKAMTQAIESKYGAFYAERLISREKGQWFRKIKSDYNTAVRYYLDWMDQPGVVVTSGPENQASYFNGFLWDILFEHCTDPADLERGILLGRRICSDNPDESEYADTLANLLYKAGRTQEAIECEAAAVKQDVAQAVKANRKPHPDIQENLEKMRMGKPTWEANPA